MFVTTVSETPLVDNKLSRPLIEDEALIDAIVLTSGHLEGESTKSI